MKVKKDIEIGKQYTVRELQEFAVSEMYKSIPEHGDKTDPKVGAILATSDGVVIATAHRGELRAGEHAEYTVLDKKCRDRKVDGCVVYATLEPCTCKSRKEPKVSCSERIVNGRIKKIYIGIQDPDPVVFGRNYHTWEIVTNILPYCLRIVISRRNFLFFRGKFINHLHPSAKRVQYRQQWERSCGCYT